MLMKPSTNERITCSVIKIKFETSVNLFRGVVHIKQSNRLFSGCIYQMASSEMYKYRQRLLSARWAQQQIVLKHESGGSVADLALACGFGDPFATPHFHSCTVKQGVAGNSCSLFISFFLHSVHRELAEKNKQIMSPWLKKNRMRC